MPESGSSIRPSVCIVGVGAIGGWLAGVFDTAGWDVRLLARGATLRAIREQGLRISRGGETRAVRTMCSDDPAVLGPADFVVLAVKNQSLQALGPTLAPLVSPQTALVTAMNGLQWWFTAGVETLDRGPALESIDPGGALARVYPPDRVIGCVVHATANAAAPGVVEVIAVDKLIFGEASEQAGDRLQRLIEACRAGGAPAQASDNIRLDVWRKLWGNMCMNPLSALTRATTGRLLDDPLTRELVRAMMSEMSALGDRLDLHLDMSPEVRMDVTRKLGDFRTSMQRDAEAGRRLELEALLGVLVEMSNRLHHPAPSLRAVYGLARQLDLSLASGVAASLH